MLSIWCATVSAQNSTADSKSVVTASVPGVTPGVSHMIYHSATIILILRRKAMGGEGGKKLGVMIPIPHPFTINSKKLQRINCKWVPETSTSLRYFPILLLNNPRNKSSSVYFRGAMFFDSIYMLFSPISLMQFKSVL